jgi:sRNA-binding regulator protein Hfq
MKVIKGVLEEELENSLRQEAAYVKALKDIPAGVLVKKEIKGHSYYYLMLREKGKVKFIYKGNISKEEIKKSDDAKKMRAKYRKLLSQTRKQISFLRKALRAKEIRAVS